MTVCAVDENEAAKRATASSADAKGLAMEHKQVVKIDIIGGFLGAGKTTFLNKLLNEGLKSERVVIIENEFGKEAVDDTILGDSGLEMRTLPSGCICCTLKSDFISSIESIVKACDAERILIEPTGLASPSELQSTCEFAAQLRDLPASVRLNSITAIVDATDVAEMIEYGIPVYLHQIEEARLIVLSHTQEIDAAALAEAIEAIRAIAPPNVMIVDAPWDELDALEVLALSEQAFYESEQSKGDGDDHDHDHDHDHAHEHHQGHHHGHEGFSSIVLTPEAPYDDQAIEQLNDKLTAKRVSRAKGFLPAADGALLHYEFVNGRARVTSTSYDGPAKLVVIGRDLSGLE